MNTECVKDFDLTRVQKSPAILNEEKLEWFNKEHMKLLPLIEIEKNILEWLPEGMKNPKLAPIIFERISKWSDVKEMAEAGEFDFVLHTPDIVKEKLNYKNTSQEKTSKNLKLAIGTLENLSEENFTQEDIKTALMLIADNLENRGELLHPVRYALSGKDQSPNPFIIASIIGKNETLSRLQKAI